MSQLLTVLSGIPACVYDTTLQQILDSGCKDFRCMCKDDDLLTGLMYALLRSCETADQNQGFEVAQELCRKTIPSLNDSKGTEIVVIVAVMTVVSTVAVILRLIGRKISAAPYGADDALIIAALILTYGLNVNEIVAVHYGFGRHQLMLSLDYIKKFLLNDWTIQILFATAISATRMSLLLFYHRLFPVRRFTVVAVITGCIMIGWWIGFILAIIFSCRPVASFWNKAIPGHCISEKSLSWGITGSELGANILMLVLPIPWLWDLRLPLSKKLALIGIFMLGCFVCISCIVRFPLLAAVVQTDASWTIVPAGIWIVVECNIGIASVCLPLMRPLVAFEFSNLSTFFSFSRSRRLDSPFSDEETKTETSTGLRSIGKLCEKPWDGSRTDPGDSPDQHPAYRNNSQSILHTMQTQPEHQPGYRNVHTHRSRIESYSPDTSKSDSLNAAVPPPIRRAIPSSAPRNPKIATKAHPPSSIKAIRSSPPPAPRKPPAAPPQQQHKVARSSAPLAPRRAESKKRPPIYNPLQAHPPSLHRFPHKQTASDRLKTRPTSTHKHKSPHQHTASDPLKARPTSIQKTQSPRYKSASIPMTNPKSPRHRSAPMPALTSTFHPYRRRSRRLTADEMNERWKMWYQGRGSEVGKGLWSLEIVVPNASKEGQDGMDVEEEVRWEVRDPPSPRIRRKPVPPKSRL
ncbi:MAG: hypothetical protein Q9184_002424 [Pyrenodesmia sp. 2 TL-2023]